MSNLGPKFKTKEIFLCIPWASEVAVSILWPGLLDTSLTITKNTVNMVTMLSDWDTFMFQDAADFLKFQLFCLHLLRSTFFFSFLFYFFSCCLVLRFVFTFLSSFQSICSGVEYQSFFPIHLFLGISVITKAIVKDL